MRSNSASWRGVVGTLVALACLGVSVGCQSTAATPPSELVVRGAIERYAADQADSLVTAQPAERSNERTTLAASAAPLLRRAAALRTPEPFFLGTVADEDVTATTRPAASRAAQGFVPPEGYWREDIWHQMGHEALEFGGHGFWHGFKTSFWNVENAVLLTATMGASIAIRETGVDDAVRRRTHGQYELGDIDEPIQLLGNPGTHFAAAGALWLGSALMKDVKTHEFAKTLTEALAVNGATTMLLKVTVRTRSPDNDTLAWPSGHTSSAFTVAAVLNEYYGPWVGIPSLALAGLVGYQRLDSRVHDFSDVVFGGMLGYVIGTSIARDEKAAFPELFGMQVVPFYDAQTGSSGLALMKSW